MVAAPDTRMQSNLHECETVGRRQGGRGAIAGDGGRLRAGVGHDHRDHEDVDGEHAGDDDGDQCL